jgi:hypothetical protein
MQTEPKWTTLKGPFFSRIDRLDKKDLRVSGIFALLTFALSILTLIFSSCSSAVAETFNLSWILLSLIQFPINLLQLFESLLIVIG